MAQFISFVGTQVMGTINSILGVMNSKEPPKGCLLLYTPQTQVQTEKIRKWLSQRFDNVKIQVIEVSLSFDIKDIPLSRTEKIYFNLSGGMNYQVASFTWQYMQSLGEGGKSNLNFVYSERESIWLWDWDKSRFQSLSPVKKLMPKFKEFLMKTIKQIMLNF